MNSRLGQRRRRPGQISAIIDPILGEGEEQSTIDSIPWTMFCIRCEGLVVPSSHGSDIEEGNTTFRDALGLVPGGSFYDELGKTWKRVSY